ncbi:nucleoside hydrolase [Bacteroidota bacterium]
MKTGSIFSLITLLILSYTAFSQDYPVISEHERIKKLEPPSGKMKMVFDTDTWNEIDDQFALIYAILSEEQVNLQAVYAAPFKNKRSKSAGEGMAKSYQEIIRILKMFNKDPKGFAFEGSPEFLVNLDNPPRSPAALDLIQKAMKTPVGEPLYVVAVGAITNVASAILIEPRIIERIVVVWLGGHAHHWPDTKEFNLWQDANAANVIFGSGVPVVQFAVMGGISHLTTTSAEIDLYVKDKGKLGSYLDEIFDEYVKGHARSKVLWDMSAIGYVIDPSWTPSYLTASPHVAENGEYTFNKHRHQIRYVYYINRDKLFGDFFKKLETYSKK